MSTVVKIVNIDTHAMIVDLIAIMHRLIVNHGIVLTISKMGHGLIQKSSSSLCDPRIAYKFNCNNERSIRCLQYQSRKGGGTNDRVSY